MLYHCGMAGENQKPHAELRDRQFLISALGRRWTLRHDYDLEEMWAAMGETDFADERIPYWTELWPASLVLAEWLAQIKERIKNRFCLDLGCGLGFTALAGQWLGAKILACDYEPASLEAAAANATANGIAGPAWLCMDWRKPAIGAATVDFIWGSDILYEKRACEPILALAGSALKPGGAVWLADPGRGVFQHFTALAVKQSWQLTRVHASKTTAVRPQDAAIPVTIHELIKK